MTNRTFMSKILIVVLAFVVALIIVEIALRVMGFNPGIMDINIFVEEENELLPYKPRPNYRGYHVGKDVAIDSEGNRVVTPGPKMLNNGIENPDTKTIVILGDSVVFGFGLRDDETIASQFQALINQKGLSYIVKNIAAPGYSSWNEYEALNQYLKKNKVDIVFLVYIPNDVTFNNNGLVNMKRYEKTKYSPMTSFLYKNLYSLSLIDLYKASQKDHSKVKESPGSENQGNQVVEKLYSDYLNEEKVNYSMEAISKIESLCEKNKIQFFVAIPRFHIWHYEYPEFSNDYETMLLDRLNSVGAEAFITTSHIENLTVEEINVFRNDYHPSPIAVKYLVKDIYEQYHLRQ